MEDKQNHLNEENSKNNEKSNENNSNREESKSGERTKSYDNLSYSKSNRRSKHPSAGNGKS